jgi:hypothetical protein
VLVGGAVVVVVGTVVGGVVVVVVGGVVVGGGVDVMRRVGWPNRLPTVVPLSPPEIGPFLSSSTPVTAPIPMTKANAVTATATTQRGRRGTGRFGSDTVSSVAAGASGSSVRAGPTRERTVRLVRSNEC